MRKNRGIGSRAWGALRRKVLERDDYTCRHCGRMGARFEVHHQDGDRHNNDLDNLVSLCRRCHIAAHSKPVSAEAQRWREY